jgi:hypothetical protein
MFKRFGLSDALEWFSLDFFDEGVNTFECFFIRSLPIKVVFPRLLCKD